MANNEIENVCRFLASKHIIISQNNEWLTACIEWFLSENTNYNVQEIQEFALTQLLLADLNVVAQECLPRVVNDSVIKLQNKYFLQVNSFFDVGESAYKQYQKILKRDVFEDDDEDRDRGVDDKKHWERQSNRMLKMEMTDGVRTVYGMEYSPIIKLNSGVMVPGVKVLVKGPVECRSGVIMIQEHNIEILGGEVDSLYEVNHVNRLIARKLKMNETSIPINDDVPQVNHSVPVESNHALPTVTQLSYNVNSTNNASPPRNHTYDETYGMTEETSNQNYFEDSDIFLNVPVDHLLEEDKNEPFDHLLEEDKCEPSGNKVTEINAKVSAFKSKLLIKDDNWSLTVKLNTSEGSMKANFDADLLDKLIGFSPVELSSKETELAVNPAIREKMDSMLKKSQQAIKNLNCSMTLVQSEGDELPVIIAIGDESAFCNTL